MRSVSFLLGFLQLFYFGFQAIYRLSDYFCYFLIGKNGGILFVYQILIQSFLLKIKKISFSKRQMNHILLLF